MKKIILFVMTISVIVIAMSKGPWQYESQNKGPWQKDSVITGIQCDSLLNTIDTFGIWKTAIGVGDSIICDSVTAYIDFDTAGNWINWSFFSHIKNIGFRDTIIGLRPSQTCSLRTRAASDTCAAKDTSKTIIIIIPDSSDTSTEYWYPGITQFNLRMVNSTPAGIISPTAGDHEYDSNTSVPISYTHAMGYRFYKWIRSNPSSPIGDSTLSSTTIILKGSDTVTANSYRIQDTLTVGYDPIGAGSTIPFGPDIQDSGTVRDITATPSAGWEFGKWDHSNTPQICVIGDSLLATTTARPIGSIGGVIAYFWRMAYNTQSWNLTKGATTGRDSCVMYGNLAFDSVRVDTAGAFDSIPPGIKLDSTTGAFYVASLTNTGYWTLRPVVYRNGSMADTVTISISEPFRSTVKKIFYYFKKFSLGM